MFPNPYAIYLHDTPTQHCSAPRCGRIPRAACGWMIRAISPTSCCRASPTRRSELYHSVLNTGQQTRLYLDDPVPVHLVYRTAFTNVRGELNFRKTCYGRDAKIYRALVAAGR